MTGAQKFKFIGHDAAVQAAKLGRGPAAGKAVSASRLGRLLMWDARTGCRWGGHDMFDVRTAREITVVRGRWIVAVSSGMA